MKLPRRHNLRDRLDFQNVRARGSSRPGRFLVLGTLARDDGPPLRTGLITTKKIGNAVTRNRVRRLFRAVLQKHGERITPPRDLVLIARWTAKDATFADIERDFLKLAQRLDILSPTADDS